jgi:hypothetical protein
MCRAKGISAGMLGSYKAGRRRMPSLKLLGEIRFALWNPPKEVREAEFHWAGFSHV